MKKCNKNNYVLFDLLNPAMTAGLDKNAEILVRRMLDLLWISETGTFPNDEEKIFLAVGKGFTRNKFEKARDEAFPIFYVTDDYDYIYCDEIFELKRHAERISKKRSTSGRKGGRPKQKPAPAPVPNSMDEKGTISGDPARRSGAVSKGGFFDEIKRMNSDSGLSDAARRRLRGDK